MKMNILVTLNSGYIKPLTVMLHSLLCSHPEQEFDVYVANCSLTDEDYKFINSHIDSSRCKLIDVKVSSRTFDDAPVEDRWPKEMYYRIFAARILPKYLDRVLYLDPDLVVIKSLNELYNMDMHDYLIAAASHTLPWCQFVPRRGLNLGKKSQYINSGVMLINLQLFRCERHQEDDVFEAIIKFRKKLKLPDQDVINILYNSRTYFLDAHIYNLDERTWKLHNWFNSKRKYTDLQWIAKNTAVIHYCGRNKPWNEDYEGKLGIFYNMYCKCLDKEYKDLATVK